MRIEFLGAQGGVADGYRATSFLINDDFLLDGGSSASALSVERQALIKHIYITHPHLDHIKDIGFMCDNCFGLLEDSFNIYAHETTIKSLKNHIFNDFIWPDFSKIPTKENPIIKYNTLVPEVLSEVGRYKVTPVRVNHPADSMGFIVESEGKSVVFSSDTGPTDKIWELSRNLENLKAIVTEVSFPNRLKNVAEISFHHTPESFGREYQKMPNVPVYLTHLKPGFQEEIIAEVQALKFDNIHIVHHDGKIINF